MRQHVPQLLEDLRLLGIEGLELSAHRLVDVLLQRQHVGDIAVECFFAVGHDPLLRVMRMSR
jgi:hypothetical protein